ncbi:MAG: stage IV sporulation protein A [Ruminococcaceae bacterium]|nr:stage IV sporulation protein A [Oscillospiraceae bacterium]
MTEYGIYNDIAKRSGGDVYVGVVGPVRTGKSTFIKRFMDLIVIPNIENEYKKARALDELPQSAGGRMIMTTEPKFIPNEAVGIKIGDGINLKVRMIDCVGYIVNSAIGHFENSMPRMVMTPWSDEPVPFAEAAETGTKKVIDEHSTIGIVVTTDGSVTEIPREDYEEAEARVIRELKAINKPFVVVLNTANPNSESVMKYKSEMEEKYDVCVLPLNCAELSTGDINTIMEKILLEFPVREISVNIPPWVSALDNENWLKNKIKAEIISASDGIEKISDMKKFVSCLSEVPCIENSTLENIDLGTGSITVEARVGDETYYKIVRETTGFGIESRQELMETLQNLAQIKKKYDKLAVAIDEVNRKGYGIVSPGIDELTLQEPEIMKQGSKFGIRLKASAPSIHMIRNKPKFLKTA